MRSRSSIARKIRVTAAPMSGKRNGSLRELRRGWRKAFTSSAFAKPFLFSSSAIQGRLQISGQAMAASGLSSAQAMIQRFCTNQTICAVVPWQDAGAFTSRPPSNLRSGSSQDQRRVGQQNSVLFAKLPKHRQAFSFSRPQMIPQTLTEMVVAELRAEFSFRRDD